MAPKITPEIRKALNAQPGEPVLVEDDETQNVYVLVDQHTHEQAMQALREKEDIASIQCGIEQMEAGQGRPMAEANAAMRQELGFPPRQ